MDSLNIQFGVLSPFLAQLRSGGSKLASSISKMLASGDFAGILGTPSPDPRAFDNGLDYFLEAQSASLLRKLQGEFPGVDRRAPTLKKWWQGEFDCYRSNERLSPFVWQSGIPDSDMAIDAYFKLVRKKIVSWIGSNPPSLDLLEGRHGPGSTFADKGRLTTVPDKMSSKPTLTRGAYWYLLPYAQSSWGRAVKSSSHRGEVQYVRGNRFTTVPKTALIDRAIAIEPSINIFYQLGYGSSIRDRLRTSTGWDLTLAQPIHRKVAWQASIDKSFCTIDLSNASDTVSYNLVKLCLPPAWFEELDALRSPFTKVEGRWCKLEKFSSMGNGFTFELETLIFAALSSVLLEMNGRLGRLGEDLFVFGDDIIVPDDMYTQLKSVLNFCGFTLNDSKSFHGTHGFRESCGGDYFEGLDVRPYFLDEQSNDPHELLPQRNGMMRALLRLCQLQEHYSPFIVGPRRKPQLLDEKSVLSWQALLERYQKDCLPGLSGIDGVLPETIKRCRGPVGLGDLVIHDGSEMAWRVKWKDGIRYFRSLVALPELLLPWYHWRPDVVYACALYGTGDGTPKMTPRRVNVEGGIIPRDPPLSYKVAWVPLS